MKHLSPEDVIAHRFTQGRRKGYDTLEVDAFLEQVAVHIGRLEAELAGHQTTERTAIEVLQQAQVVADETVAAAQREADALRQNATEGLEHARREARVTLADAQAEADRTLLSARVQAEAAVERGEARAAELEAAAFARVKQAEKLVHEMKLSVARSAGDLRTAGSQLVSMAEHFEIELATAGEDIEPPTPAVVELDEGPLPVQ